jgi:hypothetical protein
MKFINAAAGALALALALTGCNGKFVHVRSGEDPRYQDDGVRFRATHYFRVFDHCPKCDRAQIESGNCSPKSDSLYRFRMSGKAGEMTQVHFEAGTLHAHEIDPFGAAVVYDESEKRFRFKSRQRADGDAARREAYVEIRELRALCEDLSAQPGKTGKSPEESAASCFAALKAKVSALGNGAEPAGGTSRPANPTAKELAAVMRPCKPGEERRGFQILGPEGWRTFDQDERLVLAMSSSGKPLISTMRELSERMLNQKSASSSDALPFLREQHVAEKGRRLLDGVAQNDDLDEVWRRLTNALGEQP